VNAIDWFASEAFRVFMQAAKGTIYNSRNPSSNIIVPYAPTCLFQCSFFSNCTPVIGHKQFADHELPTELSITQTAALVPGRLDVCVHLDAHACSTLSAWIHAPPALASFPALASEPPAFSFTSVAHATRMTHPRLFQTGAAPVSSRPPRSSPPPLPQQHRAACASSTGQCPRLGPARPHGHQRRRSALAT
jgi:hypothetical protein